jgi:hypothetical protein
MRMMEVTASVLDGQRFLHGLPADQLDALAGTASEIRFPPGTGSSPTEATSTASG